MFNNVASFVNFRSLLLDFVFGVGFTNSFNGASAISAEDLDRQIESKLNGGYFGTGPTNRAGTNGEINTHSDGGYADAVKALEALNPGKEFAPLEDTETYSTKGTTGVGVVKDRDPTTGKVTFGDKVRVDKFGNVRGQYGKEAVHFEDKKATKASELLNDVLKISFNPDPSLNIEDKLAEIVGTSVADFFEWAKTRDSYSSLINELLASALNFTGMSDDEARESASLVGWGNLSQEQQAELSQRGIGGIAAFGQYRGDFNFGDITSSEPEGDPVPGEGIW